MSSENAKNTPAGNADSRAASVIANTAAVLRSFTIDEPMLGVTEIAARVGLHKSTVSRILAALEREHLVERDAETNRFRTGLGIIALAGPLLAELDERRVAFPVLRDLAERTGETAALMIWSGNMSVCVEQIPSRQQIKHTTTLGTGFDTALSASVQVFLAAMGPDRAKVLLQNGTLSYPSADEASINAYLQRLGEVRQRGVATNYGETSIDEVGVASPVYDHRGDVVACVLIPAPRFRVSEDGLQALTAACLSAAREVTARLGGVFPDVKAA